MGTYTGDPEGAGSSELSGDNTAMLVIALILSIIFMVIIAFISFSALKSLKP